MLNKDQVEAEAVYEEFDRISERGGVLGAMDTMYQGSKIQEESLYYERLKHTGELPLIGVNTYLPKDGHGEQTDKLELMRSTETEKQDQIATVRAFQDRQARRQDVGELCWKSELDAGLDARRALPDPAPQARVPRAADARADALQERDLGGVAAPPSWAVAGNGSASCGEGGEASVCGTRRERICPQRAFREVTIELTTHFAAGDWQCSGGRCSERVEVTCRIVRQPVH